MQCHLQPLPQLIHCPVHCLPLGGSVSVGGRCEAGQTRSQRQVGHVPGGPDHIFKCRTLSYGLTKLPINSRAFHTSTKMDKGMDSPSHLK